MTTPHRFAESDMAIPRFREAGDLTLDLFYRDGRVEDRWLGLQPREFALLWRLAARPGKSMTRQQLLAEMCLVPFQIETDGLAMQVGRLRDRLAPFGLAHLIGMDGDGEVLLHVPPSAGLFVLQGARAG